MHTKLKANFTVWSQPNCPACMQAKMLLQNHGQFYTERMLGTEGNEKDILFSLAPGVKSVPQVFVGDEHIGGLSDLRKYISDNA
jgi:glutaredoxin